MEDSEIIALYWQRDQQAVRYSADKYGPYCFRIADNILHCVEDSDECVSDTWLRAWDSMPPHRPHVLRMFFAKITRSIAFNRYRANTAQKRGGGQLECVLDELSECLAGDDSAEEQVMAAELGRFIAGFVRALPEKEGDIFVRRYFFTESIGEIAENRGLTVSNTAVILSRTRQKLRQQLIKEGYIHE